MTLVTKNSYVDNWYSNFPGTIEVGYYSKRAYVSRFTGQVLHNTGVPANSKALKLAIEMGQ